jgi:hypothetical protein
MERLIPDPIDVFSKTKRKNTKKSGSTQVY